MSEQRTTSASETVGIVEAVAPPVLLAEALLNIKFGMEFAYQQGLHEFGYDPVEVVAAALAKVQS